MELLYIDAPCQAVIVVLLRWSRQQTWHQRLCDSKSWTLTLFLRQVTNKTELTCLMKSEFSTLLAGTLKAASIYMVNIAASIYMVNIFQTAL